MPTVGIVNNMQTKVVYLTPEGAERFTAELRELVSVRRREIAERLRQARDLTQGDDPEEFDQAKTDQAFVEGRILELERLLASARQIVDGQTAGRVRLGSNVTLVDLDSPEEPQTYRIVASVEADPRRGLVSDQSPIGSALIGHQFNDEVTINAPAGAFHVRITAIS
jgi:transcription elongation factor GreA